MAQTRYAFIKSQWYSEIVDRSLEGFLDLISSDVVDVYNAPSAFELPLLAQDLARTGNYGTITCAAFIVDGGSYRQQHMAHVVLDGLMRVGLDTGIPVLSIAMVPHQFQATKHDEEIYSIRFEEKGREAAQTALMIPKVREEIVRTSKS
ncbi:riboflavin synthase subunit beta [Roseobacter sp. SK209-2-6]|uniref:6,7-dimethyl-8-ribityllumazine synthase n=1 Tax=Roseobacter sp. SK209-2-6 TaxID=388739 RepID=UPI0000F3F3B3|nr:6,7-dimethyl-8-ribityllumazine synthase [Roseobacter sp. SK209-2-6]EBA14653.1 riboflavin synthase subunit beta [Roseobacter sp. SK209-2-6]